MKVMLYIEAKNKKPQGAGLELIQAAKMLTEKESVHAVLVGKDLSEAAKSVSLYGVPATVLDAETDCQDAVLALLTAEAKESGAEAVLFAANQDGKDLAPRLAAALDTGCVTDVTGITAVDGKISFTRPAYGGTILENREFAPGKVMVASVRSGSFGKPETEAEGAAVQEKTVSVPETAVKAVLKEKVVEIAELVNLEGAEIIVAGGRGCGSPEGFALVEELAKELGGVVGASRPAIEAGWASRAHQVGQSGKNVAPKLYIACGISGAMQHISGITGSDYIVAVNKDADAAIFDVADVGIVGKIEEILPLLIEEVRKKRA